MTHNTALLIIACQNDHFPGGKFELPKQMEAAGNIVELLKDAREHHEFVIHIKHVYKDPKSPYMAEGSFGAENNKMVWPKADEAVVTKYNFNALEGTNLRALLTDHKIDDLVICGSMTQYCIVETARATLDLGYPVTVVYDACAASCMEFRGREVSVDDVQASIMASLIFSNAAVVSTDEFLTQPH
ncbi:isochorismatase family protein [Pseudovibrio sp. POLY-S9]|uniref:isochorismatase family protein n=1 Tax=Pseudovibrio sp. POLY-S9 TaxID=1576596 RepID=UPI00070A90D9|nr:isochorismatase family protein [Pseudovibrio sp. POLY-S9]